MKLRINITRDILRRSMMCGTKLSKEAISENCAIALAVRDIFPEASVLDSVMIITKKTDKEMRDICDTCDAFGAYRALEDFKGVVELPSEAKIFISIFDKLYLTPDKRIELSEFSFDIDIPQSVLDTINIDEITAIINKVDHLELV